MSRETAQLFDLMFKWIVKGASSSAVVHFINGIFKKNYPLDATEVKIEPNELVKENHKSGSLVKIVPDMVITLQHEERKDIFLIEAQINEDSEMILRIFNYGIHIALENKIISKDGSYMELDMPSPVVIYLESSNAKDVAFIRIKFPGDKSILYEVPAFKVLNHSVSELEGMALLLPFYILKIREEVEKKNTDSEKRKELAVELENYLIEIDSTLKKCQENSYITESDAAMLVRRMSQMHRELYGNYEEFTEVNMRFQELEDTGIETAIATAVDKAVAVAVDKAVTTAVAETERQGNIRTARFMKADGESMDKIMRYTGLSKHDIIALR